MGKLTIDFANGLDLEALAPSAADMKKAVKAGAELLKTYTANEGRAMLRGRYATGQTISALYVKPATKTKDVYSATVTYKGTNRRGNRHGEVAFLNEYGARGKAARPFNRQAGTKNQDAIVQRMADTIQKG